MRKKVDVPGRASTGKETATFLPRRGCWSKGAWCPCTCVVWGTSEQHTAASSRKGHQELQNARRSVKAVS